MVVCRFVKRYASKQDEVNEMATKGRKGIRQKKDNDSGQWCDDRQVEHVE